MLREPEPMSSGGSRDFNLRGQLKFDCPRIVRPALMQGHSKDFGLEGPERAKRANKDIWEDCSQKIFKRRR